MSGLVNGVERFHQILSSLAIIVHIITETSQVQDNRIVMSLSARRFSNQACTVWFWMIRNG